MFLTGSGNLTPGGLRSNREAFTVSKVRKAMSHKAHETWSSWLTLNAARLLPPDHPAVIKRAGKNRGTEFPATWRKQTIIEDNTGNILVGQPKNDDSVLIAEIPKSGNRWNQANFDLETFESFFGAAPGETQRIILTHISMAGEAGPEEIRPSVAVSSHNFRFELDAASGLSYPKDGRPIAVFVRVATRTFRYRLLMPGSDAHISAATYLKENCENSGRSLTRFSTSVDAVRSQRFFSGLGISVTKIQEGTGN